MNPTTEPTLPPPDAELLAYLRDRDSKRKRNIWLTVGIGLVVAIFGIGAKTYVDGERARDRSIREQSERIFDLTQQSGG